MQIILPTVFPVKVERFTVYVGVTGSGTQEFKLTLTGDDDGSVVYEGAFRTSHWGNVGLCEFGLDLFDAVFPRPGVYTLRLFSATGLMAERGLLLKTAGEPV